MSKFQLTVNQIIAYSRYGYIVVKNLLSSEEVHRLQESALGEAAMPNHSIDLNDQQGKKTKLVLWYQPGDDVYGLLTKSNKVVGCVNQLMEGDCEVCHFHTKLLEKEAKVGGAWEWHQDYGYWYKNEFLFPNQMISMMVAITEATKENGCLQVISGSHKMGRVDHGLTGEQVGASQKFVDHALNTMPLQYIELDPGDVLFFHPNLLHRSEANLSDMSRWSLISVYNRSTNVPYNEPSGTSTVPIKTVADDALLNMVPKPLSEASNFLQKQLDEALK